MVCAAGTVCALSLAWHLTAKVLLILLRQHRQWVNTED